MLTKLSLNNFGPLTQINWENPGNINLIIGSNGSGKTFFLKALYCVMRTLEAYRRGDDPRSASEILADKLFWTFQPEKIGDLVSKGSSEPLSGNIFFDQHEFSFKFGKDTTKQISSLENHIAPRQSNSIFLPAKEVLSLHHIILKSREEEQRFGFDDTYLDLARALRQLPKGGKNYAEFAKSRERLEKILKGKIEFDEHAGRWQFKKGNQKFPIGVTAEGIKKIAILDTLLGNRYIDTDSIVFIDEPEAALHPSAISELLEIVSILSERGIQFFLASHSYFVVKKLFIIAREKNLTIPVMSEYKDGWRACDLKEEMPDNPIIDESIKLYRKEMELVLES